MTGIKNTCWLIAIIAGLSLTSCEHQGHTISEFNGDYRYYAGIAEFFNCQDGNKYYVADAGINNELQSRYLSLGLKQKEDVYIQVTGYLKKDKPKLEGIDPSLVFVPVRLISLDSSRGCNTVIRQGD